jgi:hypothetical protein
VRVWVTGRRDCPEKGAAGERQQQQLRHRHLREAQPSRHYRENNKRTWKNTYLWEHAICASSQVTGLGWASVWL